MSLLRQSRRYLAIGVLQWLADWAVMVVLSHFGWAIETANVCGRVSGALLGFTLNGRITFGGGRNRPGWGAFARYGAMWLISTVISTLAVGAIGASHGVHAAWLTKPGVDAVLGIGTFLVSRYWIYR
ncbi:MAG TPA: GtrA family protein [Rhodanobacteraceae bacterium]|nr:GtrA family protein [Rhodanobacteraceae bacterium]